jgi:alpha-galactosidase
MIDRRAGELVLVLCLLRLSSGCASEAEGPLDAEAGDLVTTSLRPPMGWNSWNKFACGRINETVVKQTADALVASGLAASGYDTLTIDDCWSAKTRDGAGKLSADPIKFPGGMRAIGEYLHARGLRYGIYASIGTATCTGKTAGSLDHESLDVETFASWGVDYIKADRCNADGLRMQDTFARWHAAIAASGRTITLSASDNGGREEPWSWGPMLAQQWRTTGDIRDNWSRMLSMFDGNSRHAAASAPGSVNDPDMLEVGNGGMSDIEYRTHMGLWALQAAPLIAGNDVRSMSAATKAILTDPEVIDVDRDALGFQAIKAADDGAGHQVWYKPAAGAGVRVVGLLNRGDAAATLSVTWARIGLRAGSATVRDLWARTNRGTFNQSYAIAVPAHGLALLRVVGTDVTVGTGFLGDQAWTYAASEWGPVEKNHSNGETGAGDGHTLTLAGTTFAKGLGMHAPSALEYRLGGACTRFRASIGVDDEVANHGSIVFQVWADGVKIFDSGVMTGASATKSVDVDLSGRTELRLQAIAVDSTSSDHGDWANARVVCASAFADDGVEADAPPSFFPAADPSYSEIFPTSGR